MSEMEDLQSLPILSKIFMKRSRIKVTDFNSEPVQKQPKMEIHCSDMELATRVSAKEIETSLDVGICYHNHGVERKNIEDKIHSNINLDKINERTELVDRFRIQNYNNVFKYVNGNIRKLKGQFSSSRSSKENDTITLTNNDIHMNKALDVHQRVAADKHHMPRKVSILKFKCTLNVYAWTEAIRRIIRLRLNTLTILGLLLTMMATCAAAPDRTSRSSHLGDKAKLVSILMTIIYKSDIDNYYYRIISNLSIFARAYNIHFS